jgi:Zn-dependent protease/predicted transcriptional regulator
MTPSLRLFRIAGIEVGIHFSWLIIFLLVTWSLATTWYPTVLPGIDATAAWVLGAIASLLLFTSVLIHELAHSLMARAQGLEARSITLFLFGGVSNLGAESPRPKVEFLVAVVGPLTSFALAAIAFAALNVLAEPMTQATLAYLAFINVLLGVFNLIPGFPLDGGRVFRSIVWQATGSLRRATEVAARAGQLVAYGFFLLGLFMVLTGNWLGGIWIAAIGWFLHSAASGSAEQVKVEQVLRRTRVSHMLRPDTRSVPPDLTVAELIEQYLLPLNRRAMAVTESDRLVGIVTLGDIRAVPVDERTSTPVGRVMGGGANGSLVSVSPNDTLASALEKLMQGDFEQLPVLDGGRLVGMLTRGDLIRQFQLRETLGIGER